MRSGFLGLRMSPASTFPGHALMATASMSRCRKLQELGGDFRPLLLAAIEQRLLAVLLAIIGVALAHAPHALACGLDAVVRGPQQQALDRPYVLFREAPVVIAHGGEIDHAIPGQAAGIVDIGIEVA